MKKISKLTFNDKNKTVKVGFSLDGLKSFVVITGENNTGKTSFMQGINDGKVDFIDDEGNPIDKSKVKIIYIAAENIEPDKDETKITADSSNLLNRLSELFDDIGIQFNLVENQQAKDSIDALFNKVNENLDSLNIDGGYEVTKYFSNSLKSKAILRALISKIAATEDGVSRDIEHLGQGMQRLIILSFLKAYIDLLLERQLLEDHLVLILFEEPEVYLHPKFKRYLNRVLIDIAGRPNHQVIITTHDPYFAMQDFEEPERIIFSFTKNPSKETEVSKEDRIIGIEDELLHILLYGECGRKGIKFPNLFPRAYINGADMIAKNYPPTIQVSLQKYIRDQIHHPENEKTHKTIVLRGETPPTGLNYYTDEELARSIKEMNDSLSGTP